MENSVKRMKELVQILNDASRAYYQESREIMTNFEYDKLYDELVCERDAGAYLKFRNAGETDFELKEKIQSLFDDAKKKWDGILPS